MATILGREHIRRLLEDDGTLWSMDKRIQYNPETWEPLQVQEWDEYDLPEIPEEKVIAREPEVIPETKIEPEKSATACDICNKEMKSILKLKAHYFKTHKKVYGAKK